MSIVIPVSSQEHFMSNVNFRLVAVKSILQAALNRIETVGWTKYKPIKYKENRIVGYCALGAIQSVARDLSYAQRARRALENAIGIDHIMEFNDADKTRKRDVVRAFKKALKSL